MGQLPPLLATLLAPFAQLLLVGALPAPAQRATGSAQKPQFHHYHRVPSKARWSGLATGRVLLALLVAASATTGASKIASTGSWTSPSARTPAARAGHAVRNLAVVRHLALNLLRRDTARKGSIATKRFTAALDDTYRTTILAGLATLHPDGAN